MSVELAIQRCVDAHHGPANAEIEAWVEASLRGRDRVGELTIRIVDEPEARALNERWRNKAGATNVLSFPFDGPEQFVPALLGDVVICAPIVEREAVEQGKTASAHWSHMVIHGVLHLLGYDHEREEQARIMETEERRILRELGFPDPYEAAANGC